MKKVVFTRISDRKRFEFLVEGEFGELVQETFEYLEKMQAVVDAAKEFQAFTHWGMSGSEVEYSHRLTRAIEELEKLAKRSI